MKHLTKLFRAILAIAIMLCVALPTLAHDFEVDGIYYNYLDKIEKTVAVTYGGSSYSYYSNEYTGSVTIPSSVTYRGTTYSVTSIGDGAFRNCSDLTSITIPNSVTSIGNAAFYACSNLETVINLSNLIFSKGSSDYGYIAYYACRVINAPNVSMVEDFVFSKVDNVNILGAYLGNATELILPTDFNGENYIIGNYAFYNCSGLTSVTIPNSVTSIGDEAFYECTGLTSVTIGNSVTSIGKTAFYRCKGLTSITIPNSVTSIGSFAFYACSNLETVINLSNLIFSKGSSDYGYIAYYACRVINAPNVSMVEDFVFSKVDNVNILGAYLGNATELILPTDFNGENYIIGNYAFYNCSGLTSVTIPNSVTSIGDEAFYYCDGLTSVTIGNSVTSIGESAFEYCYGLTSITIPNSVTSIGDEAFKYCI